MKPELIGFSIYPVFLPFTSLNLQYSSEGGRQAAT